MRLVAQNQDAWRRQTGHAVCPPSRLGLVLVGVLLATVLSGCSPLPSNQVAIRVVDGAAEFVFAPCPGNRLKTRRVLDPLTRMAAGTALQEPGFWPWADVLAKDQGTRSMKTDTAPTPAKRPKPPQPAITANRFSGRSRYILVAPSQTRASSHNQGKRDYCAVAHRFLQERCESGRQGRAGVEWSQ